MISEIDKQIEALRKKYPTSIISKIKADTGLEQISIQYSKKDEFKALGYWVDEHGKQQSKSDPTWESE